MKLRFVLLFTIIVSQVFSQEESDRNPLEVEIIGATLLNQSKNESELLEIENSYLVGLGFQLSNKIHKRIDLSYGAGFRIVNYSEKDYSVLFQSDISNGEIADYFKSWSESSGQFHFVAGKVNLKWKSSNKRNHLYVKPGLEVWYHITTTGKQTRIQESGFGFLDASDLDLKPVTKFTIYGSGALGYQFPIKNLEFFIEGRCYFTAQKFFNTNEFGNFKSRSVGLAIGCQF